MRGDTVLSTDSVGSQFLSYIFLSAICMRLGITQSI